FGTSVSHLTNKFAWYGTPSVFDTLTQTFVSNEHGAFNAHHYRHSPSMSTYVVECDAATWARAGFVAMTEPDTIRYLEKLFGHRLVSNRSVWGNFPNLRNQRWSETCCAPRISPSAPAHGSQWRTRSRSSGRWRKNLPLRKPWPRSKRRAGRSSRSCWPPRTPAAPGTSASRST